MSLAPSELMRRAHYWLSRVDGTASIETSADWDLVNDLAARVVHLETEMLRMAVLANITGRQPGDTHVPTYMPVEVFDEIAARARS